MSSFFNRLFGKKSRVIRDHDRVWRTQTLKLNGVAAHAAWLDRHATRVLIVTHFLDTFRTLEALFHSRAIPCTTFMTSGEGARLRDMGSYQPGQILLALADILPADAGEKHARAVECGFEVCIVVAEHHPVPRGDESIEAFAERLPCSVKLCYYEALDSSLLKLFAGDQITKVMDMLSAPDTEAITHASIDRAIRSAQKKIGRKAKSGVPADSAEQWFRNNLPQG